MYNLWEYFVSYAQSFTEINDHTADTETENAKIFQNADFDAQKVSGHQIQKLPRVSANFQECPQTFIGCPENFPGCPETLKKLQFLIIFFTITLKNFPDYKNFPSSNA